MARVEMSAVRAVLEGGAALDGIDLTVESGELLTLIGPSGSGKTTLLRVLAGLCPIESGRVMVDGESVDTARPGSYGVSMSFETDPLFEHLDVAGNFAFPYRVAGWSPHEADRAASRAAGRIGVRRLWRRRPATLSGGERGLVSAGRAIGRLGVKVLLLDEPLVKADRRARLRFREELFRMHRQTGLTIIVATNDQEEAMALGQRMAVLLDGAIRQEGRPLDVYRHPNDLAVAGFVGAPPMNLIPARLDRREGSLLIGNDRLEMDGWLAPTGEETVVVGVHADELVLAPPGTPFRRILHATAGRVEDLGGAGYIRFGLGSVAGIGYAVRVAEPRRHAPGDRLELTWSGGRLRVFDPGTGRPLG